MPPSPPTYELQFRNQTILTGSALILGAVMFEVGYSSYTGHNTNGDQVRAILGFVLLVVALAQTIRWLKALPRGLITVRDNARSRRQYQTRLAEHQRQAGQHQQSAARYEQAERRRRQSLDDARAARQREETLAAELSHLADQSRRLAALLRDEAMVDRVRDLKRRYLELQPV